MIDEFHSDIQQPAFSSKRENGPFVSAFCDSVDRARPPICSQRCSLLIGTKAKYLDVCLFPRLGKTWEPSKFGTPWGLSENSVYKTCLSFVTSLSVTEIRSVLFMVYRKPVSAVYFVHFMFFCDLNLKINLTL